MRKFLVFCLIFLTCMSLMAADNESENKLDSQKITVQPILIGGSESTKKETTNPFAGAWGFYMNIILVLGGGLMLLRFAVELVGAVIFEGEDSTNKVRTVLVRFLGHVGIASLAFGTYALIFA